MTSATRIAIALLLLASAVLLGLRLAQPGADFPPGITTSGDLYADEGLHASAAVHRLTRGEWILPGDFNPVVLMPVMEVVQAAAFAVAGMSLATARAVDFMFLVLLAVAFFVLVRRLSSSLVAAAALALVLSNFVLYAFSRLALLEVPMMAMLVATLAVARSSRIQRRELAGGALVGLGLALAVLTKATALFAFPVVLAALAWRPGERPRWRGAAAALVASGLVLLVHQVIVRGFFATDYACVMAANIKVSASPLQWARNLKHVLRQSLVVERWLFVGALPIGALAFALSSDFRRHPLVIGALLWVASYLGLLSLSTYNAPRYDIVFVPPVCLLLVLAVAALAAVPRWRGVAALVAVFLVWRGAAGGWRMGDYLAHPRWSYRDMAADVRARVRASPDVPATLLGHIACQVGLAADLACVDDTLGSRDLAWRLDHDPPGWWVTLGIDPKTKALLDSRGSVELVATYHVFGDYYLGRQPVHLFRLKDLPPH